MNIKGDFLKTSTKHEQVYINKVTNSTLMNIKLILVITETESHDHVAIYEFTK